MTHSMLFSSLPLSDALLKNLETLDFQTMTPVQAKSLPAILAGQDVIAQAKTGSGKTAAFGLGILSKIIADNRDVQALVICPTRELADQVSQEIRRLARLTPNIRVLTLCGGKPLHVQVDSLKNGAHIVVGTPGRLQDHIIKNTLILKNIQTVVLDEADRMLDMGFYDEIMKIVNKLPKQKQSLLFSATYPSTITKISESIQHNPLHITLTSVQDAPDIQQIFYRAEVPEKNKLLITLLSHYNSSSAIVFCKTKQQCDDVARYLNAQSFHALALHGDLEQRERDEVLIQFSNHSCSILVATDVAARGLDIKDLPLVINYELSFSPESYVHRIGRTGRSGKSGIALTLYASSEAFKIKEIEQYTQSLIIIHDKHALNKNNHNIPKSPMRTLYINSGKKNKIRPGDILGALTGDLGLTKEQVGKIDVFDNYTYVAISRTTPKDILHKLATTKIKGRACRISYLSAPAQQY